MDQKRRRFEIRKKKKQREKLRKQSGGAKKAVPARVDATLFKRADKFAGCEEALDVFFVPADIVAYRIVHNPIDKNDALVQDEQEFEGIARTKSNLPTTIAPDSPVEEQYAHVRGWSLSFFLDIEMLAQDYWMWHDKRKSQEGRDNYIKRRGDSIARYLLAPEYGLMQREVDDNTHFVAPEYADVDLEDFRDKTFELRPLTDYRYGEE